MRSTSSRSAGRSTSIAARAKGRVIGRARTPITRDARSKAPSTLSSRSENSSSVPRPKAETSRQGIDRNPNFIPNHIYKVAAFELLGDYDQSKAAKNNLLSIKPDYKTSAVYQFYLDERLNSTILNGENKTDLDTIND